MARHHGRANLCGGWVTFWFGFRLDLTVQFSDVIFLIYLASGVQQSATRCDFESDDLCGWVQDTRTDEFDWTWQNYGTPSFHLGTGPSFDHTLGQGKAGQLLLSLFSSSSSQSSFIEWNFLFIFFFFLFLSIFIDDLSFQLLWLGARREKPMY